MSIVRCGDPETDVDVATLIRRMETAITANERLHPTGTRCDMKLATMVMRAFLERFQP